MIAMTRGTWMRLVRICGLGLISALVTITARTADAATYYVATTGSDSNPGTLAQPFRTINRGAMILKPGDTLYIRGGIYPEYLYNSIPGGTSWAAPVTVAAYPGETVTIQPPSGSARVLYWEGKVKQFIIIDGLILDAVNTLDGGNVVKIACAKFYDTNTAYDCAHHIRIQNSELKNAKGPGVLIGGSSLDPNEGCCNEFINLRVHDNGTTNFNQAFYISSSANLVERCQVYLNKAGGIEIFISGQTRPDNNIVRYNEVFHNGTGPADWRGAGILIQSNNGLVYNNIVYGNRGGIAVFGVTNNTRVYNNTVYNNSLWGIDIDALSTNSVIRNNIVFQGTAGGTPIANHAATTVLSNNLTTDPLFVDPTKRNLQLTSGSPAVDAGMTVTEVTDDFVRVRRPQGAQYDIGAYEFVSGSDQTPPAAPTNLRIN